MKDWIIKIWRNKKMPISRPNKCKGVVLVLPRTPKKLTSNWWASKTAPHLKSPKKKMLKNGYPQYLPQLALKLVWKAATGRQVDAQELSRLSTAEIQTLQRLLVYRALETERMVWAGLADCTIIDPAKAAATHHKPTKIWKNRDIWHMFFRK